MGETACEALVLGIGNLLWADEGFGVRCVETLQAGWDLPESVQVLDGGTQGLYLLPYVQAARRLIVFDAVDYGLAPGTVHTAEGSEVPRFMGAKKMSLHQTGFQEVISAAQLTGQEPQEMLLIGVQPEALDDYGGGLRPLVRERIPEAVEIALARLARWGLAPRARACPRPEASPLATPAYEGGRPTEASACRIGDARFLNLRWASR